MLVAAPPAAIPIGTVSVVVVAVARSDDDLGARPAPMAVAVGRATPPAAIAVIDVDADWRAGRYGHPQNRGGRQCNRQFLHDWFSFWSVLPEGQRLARHIVSSMHGVASQPCGGDPRHRFQPRSVGSATLGF